MTINGAVPCAIVEINLDADTLEVEITNGTLIVFANIV